MSLPEYPKYRESGVEWMGAVPDHWSVSRLGYESWVRARLGWKGLKAEEYVNDGYVLLATPNIKSQAIDFENVNYIDQFRYDESPEIQLRIGDVLLAKDGSTLGTVNVVRHLARAATVNSSIAVITPEERVQGVFLYYVLQSSYFTATVQSIKGGMGVPHLFQEDLVKFPIPLPPLGEQLAVSELLDAEVAKIDRLITEQQRLIELLKDELEALVSLSRHSAANQLVRLGAVCIAISRPVQQREGEVYRPLGLLNRGRGIFHKESREITEMGDSDFFWVEQGDLVVSGQFAWEGAVALAGREEDGCVVSHRYHVLRGKSGVALTEYICALLMTSLGDFLLNENSRGAAGRNRPLDLGSLFKEKIPVPDLQMQERIARALAMKTRVIRETALQRDLLEERRKALISAAVTGKIDVRQAVAEVVA